MAHYDGMVGVAELSLGLRCEHLANWAVTGDEMLNANALEGMPEWQQMLKKRVLQAMKQYAKLAVAKIANFDVERERIDENLRRLQKYLSENKMVQVSTQSPGWVELFRLSFPKKE